MKVLVVYHAGAASNARCIFHELSRSAGLKLIVAVPEKLQVDRVYSPSGWLVAEDESANGYRVKPLPLRDPSQYHLGFERSRLRELLHSATPDVIHVLDEATSGYLFQTVWERLTICRSAKVLFYGFDNLPLHLKTHSRIKWHSTWRQLAGGAGASTEAIERVRKAGFPADRPLQRVFWGIDAATFRPMNPAAVKRNLGLDYRHVIGFVGRLLPEKGLDVLFEAVRALDPSVHAVIIGSGPMRPSLEAAASEPPLAGRIHFFDVMPPDKLVEYVNCMDVLTIPSLTTPAWKEQYGRVIAEAFACGIPVVGSDSGAIPEVVGNAGLIVPEGRSADLAQALRSVLFDDGMSSRLKTLALVRSQEELSTTAMARKLNDLYRTVMDQ